MTYHFNLNMVDSYVVVAERNIGNALLFLIPALSGCLMVYSISKIIEKTRFSQKVLSYIGMNTLTIFIFHKVAINAFGSVFSYFPCLDIIALLTTCIGTLVASCVFSFGINKMAPNLAGRFT